MSILSDEHTGGVREHLLSFFEADVVVSDVVDWLDADIEAEDVEWSVRTVGWAWEGREVHAEWVA